MNPARQALHYLDIMGGISMRELSDEELRKFNNSLHHWEQMTTHELSERVQKRGASIAKEHDS